VRGLDTNVLVRYLAQDDPAQALRANEWMEEAVSRGQKCFLNEIVLCELIWVLRGAYEYEKADLVMVLEKLLATAQFVIEDRDLVLAALTDFVQSSGDFSDYLIGRRNKENGCSSTGTFDRNLKKSPLFTVL
jgi:predicted nucleic-acid-binding protein